LRLTILFFDVTVTFNVIGRDVSCTHNPKNVTTTKHKIRNEHKKNSD
jgi:hypothetical protein